MPNGLKDPVDNLIYEIVDHIDFGWKGDGNFLKWHGETRDTIKKYLSPYLHMPQPIENEPQVYKDEGASIKRYVVEYNRGYQDGYAMGRKDNEPLPEKKQKIYKVIKSWEGGPSVGKLGTYDGLGFKTEGAFGIWSCPEWDWDRNEYLEEQKQSTPKIEHLYYTKSTSVEGKMNVVWDKINEIIDYINNTLPTNNS